MLTFNELLEMQEPLELASGPARRRSPLTLDFHLHHYCNTLKIPYTRTLLFACVFPVVARSVHLDASLKE